jgi:hypothetical protein
MLNLQVNMVLNNIENNAAFRIVFMSPDYSEVVCIELNGNNALPYLDYMSNIEALFNAGKIEILQNDPYFIIFDDSTIKSKFTEARDMAYEYIKILCSIDNMLDLCDKFKRGRLVIKIHEDFGASKTVIYKNMRKYLQRGMTKNSLLPLQKSRTVVIKNKRGRKRSITPGIGMVVTDNDLLHIKNIYQNYYLKVHGVTIREAYKELVKKYYSYQTIDNGLVVYAALDDDKKPTFKQFKYHMNKFRDKKNEIIIKYGKNKYQQTERPTLSKEDIDVPGPGYLFEIDSTISDIYLTSNLARNVIVGKATLYIIIDVYSRLIVGYYAGFEESSWIAAMMAYINMNEDKVAYCSKYDINISKEEWPAYGKPYKINADRGETISKASDELVKHLGITIVNNPPYCPDMKGIVESWFRRINDYLSRLVPGGVKKDHLQRGGQDYREKATLNIFEFNQLIIKFILKYNNSMHKSFKMSIDMIDNRVLPIPSRIWDYGATMKRLFTSAIPRSKMILALLPKAEVTVQRGGLCFLNKLYYGSDTGTKQNWFLKSSSNPKKVDIAYDPRNLDKIYLYDRKTMEYETCNMLPKSRENYKNIMFDELKAISSFESRIVTNYNTEDMSYEINSDNEMEKIINTALKKSKAVSQLSEGKTKGIRGNKQLEKQMMREEEYFDLENEQDQSHSNETMSEMSESSSVGEDNVSYIEDDKKYRNELDNLLRGLISKDN